MYTSITVMAHIFIIEVGGKHTSLLTPEQRKLVPVSERPMWEYGSKLFMAGQITYVAIVWILKLNMLFFYQRVVRGLWVEKFIYPAMGLVLAAGSVIVLLFALVCRPFGHLFQVYPDPGGTQLLPALRGRADGLFCRILRASEHHLLLLDPGAEPDHRSGHRPHPHSGEKLPRRMTRIGTDRVQVIGPLKLPLLRRIGLYLLFGLGAFCMVAAILRIVFVFGVSQIPESKISPPIILTPGSSSNAATSRPCGRSARTSSPSSSGRRP